MCALGYTIIFIFGKNFLENWKNVGTSFNSRENNFKNI